MNDAHKPEVLVILPVEERFGSDTSGLNNVCRTPNKTMQTNSCDQCTTMSASERAPSATVADLGVMRTDTIPAFCPQKSYMKAHERTI